MIHLLDDGTPTFPHYNVCIVGSGPAGLAVCAELADSGCRMCILESGSETKTQFADSLRKVVSHGIKILPESRERILGGASHTWSGVCVPLDRIDFAARGWAYHSGWPIKWEELVPYYNLSAERYGFPQFDAFECPFIDNRPAEPGWRNCEEKVFLEPTDILRFGLKFKHLFLSEGMDLILGATVVELPAERSRRKTRVTAALCRNKRGRKILITADRFVLAAGAIDNARLLLHSKSIAKEGLGNERDQVGRYLMNHPTHMVRVIQLREPVPWLERYAVRRYEGGTGVIGLHLREPQQLKEGALNCYVQLLPAYAWTGRPEVTDWREFTGCVRAWFNDERSSGGRNRLANARDAGRTARQAFASMPTLLRLSVLRLMSHFNPRMTMIGLSSFVEMEPLPDNRITLTDTCDSVGMPIPCVIHKLSQRDLKSLQRLHEQVAADLEAMGYGASLPGPPEELAKANWGDAYHYLGTTRMGSDPSHSVVNPDLRVHTVDNLYIAGGSVFPTSGCANPTMTIVALSIRLAQHLRMISARELNEPQS